MEDSKNNSTGPANNTAPTEAKNRPTPKNVRVNTAPRKGTMQRLSQMRVIIVAVIIVGLLTGAFAAIPYFFLNDDADPSASAAPSASADPNQPITPVLEATLEPTPVGMNDVVVTVNGKKHTRGDLEKMMEPLFDKNNLRFLGDPSTGTLQDRRLFSSMLTTYVIEMIVDPIIKKHDINISEEEIDTLRNQYIDQHFEKDPKNLAESLKKMGMSQEAFEDQIRLVLSFQAIVDAEDPIDPKLIEDKAKEIYDREYGSGKIVSAIVTEDQATADKVLERVAKDPKEFAKVVQEYSIDPNTKSRDGLIGPYQANVFPQALDQAIVATDVGKFAGPIQMQGGYYVLRIDKAPTFDEIGDSIKMSAKQELGAPKWEALSAKIDKEANVQLDPRFGTWLGLAQGGIEPVIPQPKGLEVTPVEGQPAPDNAAEGKAEPKPADSNESPKPAEGNAGDPSADGNVTPKPADDSK